MFAGKDTGLFHANENASPMAQWHLRAELKASIRRENPKEALPTCAQFGAGRSAASGSLGLGNVELYGRFGFDIESRRWYPRLMGEESKWLRGARVSV